MMSRRVLWVAKCIDRSGSYSAQQRKDHIEAHFSYIETIIDSVAFAGPVTSEDGDKIIGSMLAFKTEELQEAQLWLSRDPYFSCGIWEKTEWSRFVASAGDLVDGTTW